MEKRGSREGPPFRSRPRSCAPRPGPALLAQVLRSSPRSCVPRPGPAFLAQVLAPQPRSCAPQPRSCAPRPAGQRRRARAAASARSGARPLVVAWGPGAGPPPLAHPPGVGGKARGAPPSHKRRYRTGGCGGLRHLRGLCPRSAHASLPRKPPDPITGLMAPPALASYGVDIWVSAIWSGATPLSAPGHVAPWFCPRRAG